MELISQKANLQRKSSKYLWDKDGVLRHWPIFKVLQPEIEGQIHMVIVFGDDMKPAFIVTIISDERNTVYAIGDNSFGQLGVSPTECHTAIEPREIKILRGLNIKTIYTMHYSIFAITEEGLVFAWGDNNKGLLGLGEVREVCIPSLLTDLYMYHIVDISCSVDTTFALTKDGKVLSWGHYKRFETPTPLELNLEFKIGQIGCNSLLNVIVTENGEIYSWKKSVVKVVRETKKWKKPEICEKYKKYKKRWKLDIKLTQVTFKFFRNRYCNIAKVLCGPNYALALSQDGKLFVWGDNTKGYLGLGYVGYVLNKPSLVKMEKVLEMCEDQRVYVWGKCYGTGEYDFAIEIGNEVMQVNKIVLKKCCQYFKSLEESDWSKKKFILLGKFSEDIYRAFFMYFDTNRIELPVEKMFDLLKLAKLYQAKNLMEDVEQMIVTQIKLLKSAV